MVIVTPPGRTSDRQHIVASGSFATPRRAMNHFIPDHPRRTVQIVEWFRPLEYLPSHMQNVTIVYLDTNGERWIAWNCAFDRHETRWLDVDEESGETTPIDGRVIWWTEDIDGPETPDDVEA